MVGAVQMFPSHDIGEHHTNKGISNILIVSESMVQFADCTPNNCSMDNIGYAKHCEFRIGHLVKGI